MRTYLANIYWNNLLKNKMATECWTCLRYEIEGITEKGVPLRKQGKRSRKKHLSKEAIRKIAHKQMLWDLTTLQLKLENPKESLKKIGK